MIKCKICEIEYLDIRSLSLHLVKYHKIKIKDYYDEYLKKEGEGICVECGKESIFFNLRKGYSLYCSKECMNKSCIIKEKRNKTNIEKYGGTGNASKILLQKHKVTCLEKYGTEISQQSNIIKEKTKLTNLKRYGVEYSSQTEKCKNKVKETNLQKYGVENVFQNKEIKEKQKQTILKRYGVEFALQNDNIKEKLKQTILKRYGVENISQIENNKKKIILFYENEYIKNHKNIDVLTINNNLITFKCKICNNICTESKYHIYTRDKNNIIPCTFCYSKSNHVSLKEKTIVDYIKSIYKGKIIENDRNILNGQELDVYLPEKKLAFEFDGLYWHNELNKENNYHLKKTEECKKQGIHLVHIFEDEWDYKQEIVKSRIKSLLNLNERIFARKCIIKEVNYKDCKMFLEENHIQGFCNSKYNYGLYYNNELISLMTFGKSRFKNEFELLRFCNKLNINVIGGASKLFKYFLNEHNEIKEIISFADRRWSNGKLYEKLNFKYIKNTSPSYYYIINDNRENRIKFQKHKLIKDGFDRNKSEHEIMLERKIYRIYDCGNIKYVYNLE